EPARGALNDLTEPADSRANLGLRQGSVAEEQACARWWTRIEGRHRIEADAGRPGPPDHGGEVTRPYVVQPDHQMHPRVLAANLDAITEVQPQRADQRTALRGIAVAGAPQIALELAGGDEVRERLLGERGREAVGCPLCGHERRHERPGQHDVTDSQR